LWLSWILSFLCMWGAKTLPFDVYVRVNSLEFGVSWTYALCCHVELICCHIIMKLCYLMSICVDDKYAMELYNFFGLKHGTTSAELYCFSGLKHGTTVAVLKFLCIPVSFKLMGILVHSYLYLTVMYCQLC
jgi:hypothetical protein